jgi:DNA-binding CsgD family transcriptional regulator
MPDPPSPEPDRGRSAGTPVLSVRELQALVLLAEGRSTAQIAAAMSISPNTARARIHHLRAKLGVIHRRQVVPRAQDLGLLPVSPTQHSDGRPSAIGPAQHDERPFSAIRWWDR